MKYFSYLRLCLIFLVSSGITTAQTTASDPTSFRKHLAFKLSGGAANWKMTDWNQFYGSNKHDFAILGSPSDFYGEDLNWSKDVEIEMQYIFHSKYRIGVGIGRGWGEGKFGWDLTVDQPGYSLRSIWDESINAYIIPVHLTIYNNAPSYPFKPYLGLGLDYYYSGYRQQRDADHVVADSTIFLGNIENDMSSNALGFHALVGAEYHLNRNASLFAEIKGRYAKISGYTGERAYTTDTGEVSTDQVRCYVITAYRGSEEAKVVWFDAMNKNEPLPPDEDRNEYRDGVLDFSGFSLRLGMSYRF